MPWRNHVAKNPDPPVPWRSRHVRAESDSAVPVAPVAVIQPGWPTPRKRTHPQIPLVTETGGKETAVTQFRRDGTSRSPQAPRGYR
jgi:hypothetical protein